MGVLSTTLQFALQRFGLGHFRIFSPTGRRLDPGYAEYYARGGAAETTGIATPETIPSSVIPRSECDEKSRFLPGARGT
jgi:hypothetical protein